MASQLNNVLVLQKCLIIDNKGRILVIRRSPYDTRRTSKWDFPGGGYEQGEDVIDAIKREVLEEVALLARVLTPIHIASGIGHVSEFMDGETVFAICYICTDWDGQIMVSDEHSEYQWVTPKDALKLDYGDDGGFFKSSIIAYQDLLNTLK